MSPRPRAARVALAAAAVALVASIALVLVAVEVLRPRADRGEFNAFNAAWRPWALALFAAELLVALALVPLVRRLGAAPPLLLFAAVALAGYAAGAFSGFCQP